MSPDNNIETLIGVDLGGTKVHVAEIIGTNGESGIIKRENKININANGTTNEVLGELIKVIKTVWDKDTKGIGIGIPSVCDIEKGIVYDVQNIPSWKEVHLKDILEQEFKIPVYLNNDANCFAIGEKYFGCGKKYTNFIGLILGTGMAGGIIIDNKLYNGINCGSGEFGMMPYKKHFYEHYCTGRYFKRKYNMKGEEMYKLATSGDKKALMAFRNFGKHVGNAIKAILYAYDPEAIILGGSVSKSYIFYKDEVLKSLESIVYKKTIENFRIEVSDNQNIPVLGAAALYLDNMNK
ncbi:MAG: ROK family protein [Saprospiraceae bacterium]